MDGDWWQGPLDALLAANSFTQIFEVLARHPEILRIEAVERLDKFAQQHQKMEQRRRIFTIMTIIRTCVTNDVEQSQYDCDQVVGTELSTSNDLTGDSQTETPDFLDPAMAAISEIGRILSVFSDRQGVVSASLYATIGFILQNAMQAEDADRRETIINAFEGSLEHVTRENDPYAWALISSCCADAYLDWLGDQRARDIERAIYHFKNALTVFTQDHDAPRYAMVHNSLGNAYRCRMDFDAAKNIEQAIECYKTALPIWEMVPNADAWADTCNNLGAAYSVRLGDVEENVEEAIRYYKGALNVWTKTADAQGWAMVSNNLGIAYINRLREDYAANIEQAIKHFDDALTVRTLENDERAWADTRKNLGLAYSERGHGERGDNLERAIECLNDALQVREHDSDRRAWAEICNGLGAAYNERLKGDRADNIEQAIKKCGEALTIWSQKGAQEWAGARNNLGNAFKNRLRGDRSENIERAIACYEDALSVWTSKENARSWAGACNNLGIAFCARLRQNRAENVDRAIGCFKDALTVRTSISDRRGWAETLTNLGVAYWQRPTGERVANLQAAIQCFEDALTVRQRESDAWHWAETRNNLGLAHLHLLRDNGGHNEDEAIRCFQDALSVWTQTTDMQGWAMANYNLGMAYGDRRHGKKADNIERSISFYRQAVEAGAVALSPAEVIKAHGQIARGLLQLGGTRRREAWEELRKAETVFEQHSDEALTPESRRQMLAALADVGRFSAIVAVEDGDVDVAIEKLEASRANALRELLSIDVLLRQHLNAETRAEIISARQIMNNLRAEATLPMGPGRARPFPEIVSEFREAKQKLTQALASTGATPPRSLGIDAILKAIPSQSVLIVPVATEFGGLLFIIPAETPTLGPEHVVRCPELTADAVHERLSTWLNHYSAMLAAHQTKSAARSDAWNRASETLEGIMDWLWQVVMEPALIRRSELGSHSGAAGQDDVPELLIMPTGKFALMPLHAAWRDQHGQKRTVLDDFTVSYTPSLYAMFESRRDQSPNLDLSEHDQIVALLNPTGDLTYSEEIELPALRRLFPESQDRLFIGKEATKLALKQRAAQSIRLHLSCHGQFDTWTPDRSGLLLAGWDVLTLPEIAADLDLRTCLWVMLAACETGMTDVDITPEEAIGQVTAFRQAGAACVTATFWSIQDSSTALFVKHAFECHRQYQLNPKRATREAALWLRDCSIAHLARAGLRGFAELLPDDDDIVVKSGAAKPFHSPLFWAAFACWAN